MEVNKNTANAYTYTCKMHVYCAGTFFFLVTLFRVGFYYL